MKRFGIQNYFQMYKMRGLRLVVEYFLFNHLFDLLNKTDTHAWNTEKPPNNKSDENAIYMSTWVKDVKFAMSILSNADAGFVQSSDLIDVGSGKGKVLLAWSKLYKNHTSITGLEFNEKLIEICKENFRVSKMRPPTLVCDDANKIHIESENQKRIFFMYNPFGAKTVGKFFEKNGTNHSIIIYFNPIGSDVLEELGYRCLYEKVSYRKGSAFKIFGKTNFLFIGV